MPDTLKTAPLVVALAFKGLHTNGRAIVNTYHLQYSDSSGLDDADGAEIATKAAIAWQDEAMDYISDNYTFQGVSWIDLNSEDGRTGLVPPQAGHPSTGADAAAAAGSPQVTLLIKKAVGGSARGQRSGRMFVSPVSEVFVTENGQIGSSELTSLQTKWTAFYVAMNSITYSGGSTVFSCLPHWKGDDDPGDGGGEWPATGVSAVSGLTVDPRVATQRRRMRG